MIALGQIVRSGRTLIVTMADVFVIKEGKESICALMQQIKVNDLVSVITSRMSLTTFNQANSTVDVCTQFSIALLIGNSKPFIA